MEIERFRKILREEIKKAFQEELRSILVEAVQIASTPESVEKPVQKSVVKPFTRGMVSKTPISSLLESTKSEMTKEDYENVSGFSGSPVSLSEPLVMESEEVSEVSDSPMLDALPDFAKNAGEIFRKSLEKKVNAV